MWGINRIMNYAEYKMNKDNKRCETERREWVNNNNRYYHPGRSLAFDDTENENENGNENGDGNKGVDEEEKAETEEKEEKEEKDKEQALVTHGNEYEHGTDTGLGIYINNARYTPRMRKKSRRQTRNKQKNPGLQFDQLDKKQWQKFIGEISESFLNNTASKDFADYLASSESNTMNQADDVDDLSSSDDVEDEAKHSEIGNKLTSNMSINSGTFHDFESSEKKIMGALLENTNFDIIVKDIKPEKMNMESNKKYTKTKTCI